MLFVLGVLVAIGSAGFFGILGLLTLIGGADTLRTEVPRDYLRTQASGGVRATTLTVVGVPMLITAIFGVISALRFLQVAFGLV